MPFEYNPDDAKQPCLIPGEYQASLDSCEEKTSKKGNRMLVCDWTVRHGDHDVFITDYIVVPKGLFKLKQMAKAWNQLDDFESGMFDPFAWTGRVMTLVLDIESQAGYDDKNRIKGFKCPAGAQVINGSPKVYDNADADESIPF